MTFPGAALTLTTAVATLSFTRVFGDTTDVIPALGAALGAHLISRLSHEYGWSFVTSAAALGGSLILAGAWGIEASTTAWGVPTPETLGALGNDLAEGFGQVRTAEVPIFDEPGIVAIVTAIAWLAGIAADGVAFRSRAVLSAVIPALTLFTLTSSLGTGDDDLLFASAFVAAALLYVLVHAPARATGTPQWFTIDDRRRGVGSVVRAGLPLVVIAAVAAPLLGPRLPDARSAGLVDLAEGGPDTRVTVSPLVDIRDRLTQDPPIEAFRVSAPAPAYWRLAALETYDGQIWSSLADFESADGEFPPDSREAPTVPMTQQFSIRGLAQFWLPAAYRPVRIDLDGARVNPDSLTLLTDRPTADGLAYTVESEVPRYGPADLANETRHVPEDVAPLTEVPGGLPLAIAELVRELTEGLGSTYDRMLALQQFFRAEFTYSEEVPAGHSDDRMVDFLFHARAGYCEQFSSSFAVMARSLGVPARVAVGFTPGALDASGDFYTVTSAEAHAWPEVFIDPYGWVPFEPTPTRFNPSPANHTQTFNPEAQETPQPQTAQPSDDQVVGTEVPVPDSESDRAETSPDEVTDPADPSSPWPRRLTALGAVIVLGLVVLMLVAFGRWRATQLQRRGLRDPAGAVEAAWQETVERLRTEGVGLTDALTPFEVETVARAHSSELSDAMAGLREIVDLSAYSPQPPTPEDAVAAWAAAETITATLDGHEPGPDRVRRVLTTGLQGPPARRRTPPARR